MSAVQVLRPQTYGKSVGRLYPFVYGPTIPPSTGPVYGDFYPLNFRIGF